MKLCATSKLGLALLSTVGLFGPFASCAGSRSGPVVVASQTLMGFTEERLLTCAGPPIRKMSYPASTLLMYYREAAMFEESFGGGKGSKPGYHHGCWATLLIEENHVTGVEFRPVPDPDADVHECQEIFATCTS